MPLPEEMSNRIEREEWLHHVAMNVAGCTVNELFLEAHEVGVGAEDARQAIIDIRRNCWFADQDLDDVQMFVIDYVREAKDPNTAQLTESDIELAERRHATARQSLKLAEEALRKYRRRHPQ
jgi:hypothetical protein